MVRGLACCENAVLSSGNPEHGVMFVGIAPEREEHKTGEPFTGQNGRFLNALLENVGWSRERCYFANLVCHNIPLPEKGVDLSAHTACVARFEREVKEVKPRLIIPLGSDATIYMRNMKVGKARGVPVLDKTRNCYVMPTFQPLAALKGDSSIVHHLVRDLRKIPDVLRWPLDGSIKRVDYTVIDSVDDAQRILNNLPKDRFVALDIETDNKYVNIIDVFSDRLLCLAISYGTNSTEGQRTFVFTRHILDDLRWPTDVMWTFQNGAFDANGLKKYLGVELPIVHDTMLMSYALDERGGRDELHDFYGGIHGLGPQADELLGAEFYKDRMKGKDRAADLPVQELHEYNAHDAGYTERLPYIYFPRMMDDDVVNLYENRLMPLQRAYAEMNYEGIDVDRKRLQDLILDWGPRFLNGGERLQEMAREYGFDGDINLNSPKQLSKFLYEVLSLEGGPSTAREVLEELDHPFVDAMLEHRRLDHIWKHYIIPGVQSIKVDGRVHPSTMVHGTTSGRPAYVNPPMNTLPQKYTVGEYAEIRSVYVPQSSDYLLCEFDYTQIEVWIAAAISQDSHMLAALKSGDYHSATARNIMGLPIDEMEPDERQKTRQIAKKVGFGVIYLIGAKALSKKSTGINSTVQEAQKHIDAFFNVNYEFKEWVDRTILKAKREGELRTAFERVRRFRIFVDQKQERQAVNFLIQSPASDYTLSALIEFYTKHREHLRNLQARALMTIYDSIVFEIHKSHARETIDFVKSIMEQVWIPDLPGVKVEPKIGPNLYDTHEVKFKATLCTRCNLTKDTTISGHNICLECYVAS